MNKDELNIALKNATVPEDTPERHAKEILATHLFILKNNDAGKIKKESNKIINEFNKVIKKKYIKLKSDIHINKSMSDNEKEECIKILNFYFGEHTPYFYTSDKEHKKTRLKDTHLRPLLNELTQCFKENKRTNWAKLYKFLNYQKESDLKLIFINYENFRETIFQCPSSLSDYYLNK